MNSSPNRRSRFRKSGAVALSVLALLFVAACKTADKTKPSAIPVRIALTNTPLPYLPVFLAEALGFYKQEGLSVTIDDFSSASKVMQALLGSSADVGAGSYEQDIQVAAEGRHVKSFVTILRQSQRVIVVAPKAANRIKSVEDLKGAIIGVAGLGSINHLFLNYVLLKHGIAPLDVKTVAIGTAAASMASITHNLVDAAVLSGSETRVVMRRDAGVKVLVDARGPSACRRLYGVDVYPTAVLYATDGWLRESSDRARRVAKAIRRTLVWISEHSPEEIVAATPRRYRTESQEAELEALRNAIPSFSRDGVMPREGAEAVRKALAFTLESVRNAKSDLSQTYTNEFVAATSSSQTR